MSILALRQVSKVFDRTTTALDHVTLDVADGEVWGIVGPSGSGKTTLLRLVAGLEEPTTGRILIGDRCVNAVPPHRRDVAMVFQNYPLYPHMTVRQNLAFPLKRLKVPKARIAERMERIVTWLEIHDLQDRMPAALSGGQRQRVALGKALIRQPSVLLLDEPLSSVDAPLRDRLRRQWKAILTQARATCLYVTHDQAEAMAVADRICVLQAGRIQQIGTARQVYERPANRFVAGFFGTPAMNFTEAIVQSDQDTLFLVLSGGERLVLPALKRSGGSCASQVVMGVRPQDITILPVEECPVHGLIGTVTSVESLGSRTDVCVVDRTGRTWVVSSPGRVKARPQDPVALTLDVNKVHLFESGPLGRNLDGS
jgi:multiple sugar transport system ATP-binding protein